MTSNNQGHSDANNPQGNLSQPSAPYDLPPPYSEVVDGPAYGFTAPSVVGGQSQIGGNPYPQSSGYPHPQPSEYPPQPQHGGFAQPQYGYPYPQSGYPHPKPTLEQPMNVDAMPTAGGYPTGQPVRTAVTLGVVLPPAVGSKPTGVTCFTCGQWVTTRVTYRTSWHTHLAAGAVCFATMFCSMCCLGFIPYCFDTFKDAEHYCPSCNSFIGKYSKF